MAAQSRANLLAAKGLTRRIFELFGDGEVHIIEEVEGRMGHMIPAEIAVRMFDRYRDNRNRDVPISRKVEMGRRWRLMGLLRSCGAKSEGPPHSRWLRFRLYPRASASVSGLDLTDEQVAEIKRRLEAKKVSAYEIAREYKLTRSQVQTLVGRRAIERARANQSP